MHRRRTMTATPATGAPLTSADEIANGSAIRAGGTAAPACGRPGRPMRHGQEGFTLVELLVAMLLFSILSAITLSAVIGMAQGLERTRRSTDIAAEARTAVERIGREMRQASTIDIADAHSLKAWIDFNGDGVRNGGLDDPETIQYSFTPGTGGEPGAVGLAGSVPGLGTVSEALLAGHVESLTFTYSSSDWSKDGANGGVVDGEVTLAEAGIDGVDRVAVALTVVDGENEQTYRTQVTLRNRSQK